MQTRYKVVVLMGSISVMANAITISALLILFCLSAASAATRKLFYPTNLQDHKPQVGDDGVCKSMVKPRGYACEEHTVTTKDGYILAVQRIPGPRSGNKAHKTPVLLQHGILMDGVTWLMNPPDQSLAFLLSDNGFDVWIANTRGTKYSRRHKSLTPNDPDYWDWTWDELSAFDLTAIVSYVHGHTGQKLHYVGHSLGSLIAFAAFSQHKLVHKVRSAALLCPVAYLNQIKSTSMRVASHLFLAEKVYWLGVHEFNPRGKAAANFEKNVCKIAGVNCTDLIDSLTGPNCCLNSSLPSVFLAHEPQSTSSKNIIHLAQMVRSGSIRKYDYGNAIDNLKHYGQSTPPAYNLADIPKEFPLFLGYGGKDYISDVNDVQHLLKTIKDHNPDRLVTRIIDNYAHEDFIFGVNANNLVFKPIIAFFNAN